jgi:hypothetical protein
MLISANIKVPTLTAWMEKVNEAILIECHRIVKSASMVCLT